MKVANGRIRRNYPQLDATFRQAELAHSGAGRPAADIKAAPPARSKRLALWVASASALAVGVGIVAYGDRFDYDHTLRTIGPTSPAQLTSWSGHVAIPSSPPNRGTAVASAEPAPPVSSAQSDQRAGPTPDSVAPQSVTRGPDQASYAVTQHRHHSAPHVRAIARHASGITQPTSATQETSSSGHVASSSSPPVQGTAIGSAELAPPVSSDSFDQRDASPPKSALLQFAEGLPVGGHGGGGSGAGGNGGSR